MFSALIHFSFPVKYTLQAELYLQSMVDQTWMSRENHSCRTHVFGLKFFRVRLQSWFNR